MAHFSKMLDDLGRTFGRCFDLGKAVIPTATCRTTRRMEDDAMIFRLYYDTKGGHTHCRLFAGNHDGALGNCGGFTMRNDEFAVFKEAATFMQFREDVGRPVPMHGSGPARVQ